MPKGRQPGCDVHRKSGDKRHKVTWQEYGSACQSGLVLVSAKRIGGQISERRTCGIQDSWRRERWHTTHPVALARLSEGRSRHADCCGQRGRKWSRSHANWLLAVIRFISYLHLSLRLEPFRKGRLFYWWRASLACTRGKPVPARNLLPAGNEIWSL